LLYISRILFHHSLNGIPLTWSWRQFGFQSIHSMLPGIVLLSPHFRFPHTGMSYLLIMAKFFHILFLNIIPKSMRCEIKESLAAHCAKWKQSSLSLSSVWPGCFKVFFVVKVSFSSFLWPSPNLLLILCLLSVCCATGREYFSCISQGFLPKSLQQAKVLSV